MKLSSFAVIFTVFFVIFLVASKSHASFKPEDVFTQCTVTFPDGVLKGVCVSDGTKYYRFANCDGKILAFIAPDALPRVDGPTCGPTIKGYP